MKTKREAGGSPRQIILSEMGLNVWQFRSAPENRQTSPAQTSPQAFNTKPAPLPEMADAQAGPAESQTTNRQPTSAISAQPVPSNSIPTTLTTDAVAHLDWDSLSRAVQECRACELCQHRRQAVLGVGDQRAKYLFIGEGPGAEEDARGEPFVGQAGKLLDAMLAAIGLKRGEGVYIANAVKCRPPGNRTPAPAEVMQCKPFLLRQIELIQPRLIVLLGKTAVQSVLNEEKSLGSMRKRVFQYAETPVIVSYHPAYLLRNLPDKAKAWEDLCLARQIMNKSEKIT